MTILDKVWFGGRMGIVKVQTEYDGIRFYAGPHVLGNSEQEDMEHIAAWGSTVDPEDMKRFFAS